MAFNYSNANISDKILAIGELEHIYRHALRSMVSPNIPDEERIWYAVLAKQTKEARRKFMSENFGDIPDELWCLAKASASLRQLSYESFDGNMESVKSIDALVDSIWSKITGEDMTGCKACTEDKKETE